MLRHEWKFSYAADELAHAAKEKLAHHTARLAWWEGKKGEIVEKIKAEGIEIDESVANMLSNSYQRDTTVNIRNDLLKDLQECIQKVKEHRAKCGEYTAWGAVMESQGKSVQQLHHDDWHFFFGK